MSRCRFAVAMAVLLLEAEPAIAHGTSANQVQLVLHENVVEVLATPPTSVVLSADRNGDGLLSREEVAPVRAQLRASLRAMLRIDAQESANATVLREELSVPVGPRDDDREGQEFLRLSYVLQFAAPPTRLRVRCEFVREHPVGLFAIRADARARPGVLTLLGEGEQHTLTSSAMVVEVLRSNALASTTATVLPRKVRAQTLGVVVVCAFVLSGIFFKEWLQRRRGSAETMLP